MSRAGAAEGASEPPFCQQLAGGPGAAGGPPSPLVKRGEESEVCWEKRVKGSKRVSCFKLIVGLHWEQMLLSEGSSWALSEGKP